MSWFFNVFMFSLHHKYNILKSAFLTGKTSKSIVLSDMYNFLIIFSGDGQIVDLYEVFCGLLYVLKSGCQWRMLPGDFPKWRTVYEYYRKWGEVKDEEETSPLEQVLKKIGWAGPVRTGAERVH